MLDITLLSLYISRDTYSGKSTISSKSGLQVQVALVSRQKMDGPMVMTMSVVDRLIHGKNGDYESSVLDHTRKKPYSVLVLLDIVLLALYISREFRSRLC